MQLNPLIEEEYIQRAHRPAHLFRPNALYSLSVGTFRKKNIIDTPEKKSLLIRILFEQSDRFLWQIEAWSILSNHYHLVMQALDDSHTLPKMLQSIHSITAREYNKIDQTPGRKVWYQYWDTCITNELSYYARLRYVHENLVKHGIVNDAVDYPWCSKYWIHKNKLPMKEQVLLAKTDCVSLFDDF